MAFREIITIHSLVPPQKTMPAYQKSTLWKTAFPEGCTEFTAQRKRLTEAYERFHERVAKLLELIKAELPDRTLHHIIALAEGGPLA